VSSPTIWRTSRWEPERFIQLSSRSRPAIFVSSVVICAMPTVTVAKHLTETFAYLSALLGQPARCTDRTGHITVRTG